jgi:hypothetical protein
VVPVRKARAVAIAGLAARGAALPFWGFSGVMRTMSMAVLTDLAEPKDALSDRAGLAAVHAADLRAPYKPDSRWENAKGA